MMKRYGGNLILKGTTFTKYKQFVDNCFKTLPRQALHAKTLGFEHPTTKEFMRFNTEIPQDLVDLISEMACVFKAETFSEANKLKCRNQKAELVSAFFVLRT